MTLTTIAISNQKGGVAKTTTTLSLGACLAELGHSVLLIDLDPQAHLTLSLGLQPQTLRRTISDALLANASLVSTSRESPVFALDIAPANQGLALIEKLLYDKKDIEVDTRLKESPAFGQPITLYAPHTRGAQQYRTLAQELIHHGR